MIESTRLQLSEAPGTLSPEISLEKSVQVGFRTDTPSWTESQPKDTEQRDAVIVSKSHNRAVFTRDAGLRINLLKEVFMYQLGSSTRQDFYSISRGNEMAGICQHPGGAGIYKGT